MAATPRPATLILFMLAFLGLDLVLLGLSSQAAGLWLPGLFVLLAAAALALFRRFDRGSWRAAFA